MGWLEEIHHAIMNIRCNAIFAQNRYNSPRPQTRKRFNRWKLLPSCLWLRVLSLLSCFTYKFNGIDNDKSIRYPDVDGPGNTAWWREIMSRRWCLRVWNAGLWNRYKKGAIQRTRRYYIIHACYKSDVRLSSNVYSKCPREDAKTDWKVLER